MLGGIAEPRELNFRGHIAELDGLRAIAVSLVLVAHFAPAARDGSVLWWFESVGNVGVDLFFVLSGFLIAGVLLDSRKKENYYRNFYLRRALRIFPLYYLFLIICTTLYIACHLAPRRETLYEASWYFLYLGNFRATALGAYPFAVGFLIPLWSLQIEEQFYSTFPFLVRNLSTTVLQRILIGVVVLSGPLRMLLYLWHPDRPLVEYLAPGCRMDGLAIGALIAIQLRKGPWRFKPAYASIAAIATTGAFLGYFIWGVRVRWALWTFGFSVAALAFASVLLWVLCFRDTWQTAWLRIGPLQYVGKISYGIYLLQVPAFLLARYAARHLEIHMVFSGPGDWKSTGWREFGMVASVGISLASLSWILLEKPVLAAKDTLTNARLTLNSFLEIWHIAGIPKTVRHRMP
jgi:peptidoglycan/LPS O-acetylase OafA/YrhL